MLPMKSKSPFDNSGTYPAEMILWLSVAVKENRFVDIYRGVELQVPYKIADGLQISNHMFDMVWSNIARRDNQRTAGTRHGPFLECTVCQSDRAL